MRPAVARVRRAHQARRVAATVAVVLTAGSALAGCGSGGAASAAHSDAFVECLADQSDYGDLDPDVDYLDGIDDLSRAQEIEFWSQPAILDCAVRRLDADERRDALATAFPTISDDGSDDLPDDELERQWQMVNVYMTWVVEQDDSTEVALLRAGDLVSALWVADADESFAANGFSEVAALAAMRADDDLPGFEPFLRSQDDSADDAEWLILYAQNSLGKTEEAGGDPDGYSRFRLLTTAVLESVRE